MHRSDTAAVIAISPNAPQWRTARLALAPSSVDVYVYLRFRLINNKLKRNLGLSKVSLRRHMSFLSSHS